MTKAEPGAQPAWVQPFLQALGAGHSVVDSARAAGIERSTPYQRRRMNAQFARDWKDARGAPDRPAQPEQTRRTPHWRKNFLEVLAETSNVTAAAASANVPTRTAYKLRREDSEFAAKWLAALLEGYEHLEMEVLGYLRNPEPGRKMDVASALRLLAAHRETVARERALQEEEDEQAVLDSIDAFIDEMRERRAANAALLAEAEFEDGAQ